MCIFGLSKRGPIKTRLLAHQFLVRKLHSFMWYFAKMIPSLPYTCSYSFIRTHMYRRSEIFCWWNISSVRFSPGFIFGAMTARHYKLTPFIRQKNFSQRFIFCCWRWLTPNFSCQKFSLKNCGVAQVCKITCISQKIFTQGILTTSILQ